MAPTDTIEGYIDIFKKDGEVFDVVKFREVAMAWSGVWTT